jgi:hypothetical protein
MSAEVIEVKLGEGRSSHAEGAVPKREESTSGLQPQPWLIVNDGRKFFAAKFVKTSHYPKDYLREGVRALLIIADCNWPITIERQTEAGTKTIALNPHQGARGEFATSMVYLHEGTSRVMVGNYELTLHEGLTWENHLLSLDIKSPCKFKMATRSFKGASTNQVIAALTEATEQSY